MAQALPTISGASSMMAMRYVEIFPIFMTNLLQNVISLYDKLINDRWIHPGYSRVSCKRWDYLRMVNSRTMMHTHHFSGW